MEANSEEVNDSDNEKESESDHEGIPGPSSGREREKRSFIWQHFKRICINGKYFAKCKYCTNVRYGLSEGAHGSTGNMASHLRKCHKSKLATASADSYSPSSSNKIPQYFSTTNKVFHREIYRKNLLKWIVLSDQPHTEVENPSFQEMLASVNPSLPNTDLRISAGTIKNDLMVEWKKRGYEIKSDLQDLNVRVSFTHDCYTSKNMIPFLGVKIHWISSEWVQKSIRIGFVQLKGPHTGENVCGAFHEILNEFEIKLKSVNAITTDNATNNDTFFQEFQTLCSLENVIFSDIYSRVNCTAHVFNLAVQDFLDALRACPFNTADDQNQTETEENEENTLFELSDLEAKVETKSIIRLRKLVRMIRSSPQRREKLSDACISTGTKPLQLIIDVKTRWNSTYAMISRAIELKVPLLFVCSYDKDLKKSVIGENEWQALESVQAVLKKFERATQHISMSRHPSVCSLVPMYDWLIQELDSCMRDNNSSLAVQNAATKAFQKLRKYEPNPDTRPFLFIAVVLRPSLKLNYFKEHHGAKTVKKIKDIVTKIYCENYETRIEDGVNNPTEANPVEDSENSDPEDEFSAHINKRSKTQKKLSEIQEYLSAPLVSSKVNTLQWWKTNEVNFPKLSQMAKDYFAIQPTTVPMETEFAGGVDLVVPTRYSLYGDTISATMCLKSWWKEN